MAPLDGCYGHLCQCAKEQKPTGEARPQAAPTTYSTSLQAIAMAAYTPLQCPATLLGHGHGCMAERAHAAADEAVRGVDSTTTCHAHAHGVRTARPSPGLHACMRMGAAEKGWSMPRGDKKCSLHLCKRVGIRAFEAGMLARTGRKQFCIHCYSVQPTTDGQRPTTNRAQHTTTMSNLQRHRSLGIPLHCTCIDFITPAS